MILVVGATGLLGGMITRQLLDKGQEVRILVRHHSPSEQLAKQGKATFAQSLIEAGAQPVYGDLRDRPSLDQACGGIETVITTATAALRYGEDNFESVDLLGTKSLIEAAKAAAVQHFIYMSILGSDPDHPHPLFRAKGQGEAYLKKSGLTYTILKPRVFMDMWIGAIVGAPLPARQPVTLVDEGADQQVFASIADVAACAVTAVDNPAAKNREINVGGPTSCSWAKATKAAGRAVEEEFSIHYVSPGDPIPLVP